MITPAEKFAADDLKRETLLGLLRSPELHEALQLLKDELEPDALDAKAIEIPTVAVSQRHLVAGANHIIRGLKRLTTVPPKREKPPRARPLLTEKEFLKQKEKEATK